MYKELKYSAAFFIASAACSISWVFFVGYVGDMRGHFLIAPGVLFSGAAGHYLFKWLMPK